MASVSMVMPLPVATHNKGALPFSPLAVPPSRKCSAPRRLQVVKASLKDKAVAAATTAALTASVVMPQVAEAAELAPSLKNFLGSIIAGGVVLGAIGVAVVGVSYFDPVKRG